MKIRSGFVSNSSSSSFIIVMNYIHNAEEAVGLAKEGKNVYVIGGWIDNGVDFFPLKKEMYDFILSKSSTSNYFNFFLVHLISEGEIKIRKEDLNWDNLNEEPLIITHIEADDCSCETIKDLKEIYGEIK